MSRFVLIKHYLNVIVTSDAPIHRVIRHSFSMSGQSKIRNYIETNIAEDIPKEPAKTISSFTESLTNHSTENCNMPKRKLSDTEDKAAKSLKNAEDSKPTTIGNVAEDAHDDVLVAIAENVNDDKAEAATIKGSVGATSSSADATSLEERMKSVAEATSNLVSGCGESWFRALGAEFSKPYFLQLSKFVAGERKKFTIFPPESDVFSWTRITPIEDIKVVILGQDPYHGPGQAHGLSFSVPRTVSTPPSLKNVYKELTTDIPGFVSPGHGDLTGWAKQGVLLLNAVLTVRQGAANSHKDKGWETFTDAVIYWLNINTRNTVFILWGAYAQKKGARINKTNHRVINGVHPSGLSASKGFFGGKHFSKCNDYLTEHRKGRIDWAKL